MPFLTISTLLVLAGVFGGGCLVAWYVTDRKHERRRTLLEETMTRELEQRYHVYVDLEKSFHRVFARLDELKASWMETSCPSLPEHNLMRVENPELWDLEREYERRQAEQLAEISDKSRRVVELMGKIEALEPLAQQLAERDQEFVQMEENHRALEDTRRAHVAELTRQVAELEPLRDEVADLSAQLERAGQDVCAWRDKHDSLLLRATEDQARLTQELDETNERVETQREELDEVRRAGGERVEALEAEVAGRDGRIEALCAEVEELRSRIEALDSQVFMRDELVKERDKQLADLHEELARTRTERDRRIDELAARDARLQELEGAWNEAKSQVANQRSKLIAHLGHFEAAQSMLAQVKPMLEALESNLTVEEQEALENARLESLPDVAAEIREELAGVQELEELEEDSSNGREPAAALPAEPAREAAESVVSLDEGFDLSVLDGDGAGGAAEDPGTSRDPK